MALATEHLSHDSELPEPVYPERPLLDCLLEAAPSERPDLEGVIDLIKKSIKSYIPFTYEKTDILFPKEFIPDEKYDVFFAKISKYMYAGKYRYTTIAIKNQKAFICEGTELPDNIFKKHELSLKLSEKAYTSFISLMKNFKSLNKISKTASEKEMVQIINRFDSLGGFSGIGEKIETIHIYGLDSTLFGISFGGYLLDELYHQKKEKNNAAYIISSLFLSYESYMDDLKKDPENRNDASINKYFEDAINKIEFKNNAPPPASQETDEDAK